MKEYLDSGPIIEYAACYAHFLRSNKVEIIKALNTYETHKVVYDEFERTLDLFENLGVNKDYFIGKVDKIIVFLPINQPLYAFACFAIVPSLMAKTVFVRPPVVARELFKKLEVLLQIRHFFKHIHFFYGQREHFIGSHVQSDLVGKRVVVIFTGQPAHGLEIQQKFGNDVLFIGNGASHNPVVITETADIEQAVRAVMEVQLYNQGADCAAPNSILVSGKIYNAFLKQLSVFH